MKNWLSGHNLKALTNKVDWQLLLFLVLFLNVKLVVKLIAIVVIYLWCPNFKFGFKLKTSRLPLFYPGIMAIALLDLVLYRDFKNPNYPLVFAIGIGFWAISILVIHQIKLFVERNSAAVIHRTLLAFFAVNIMASAFNLAAIVWETHVLNPYLYQGEYQKYFISTGDFIKGISFDNSTTNAVINAFGVIYFLEKKNALMTVLCMAVLLLAGSNFTNVILLACLGFAFLFRSDRDQKSIIATCLMLVVVFMVKVSPQNNDYVINTVKSIIYQKKEISKWPTNLVVIPVTQRPVNQLSPEEKKQRIALLYIDSVDKAVAAKINAHLLPAKPAIVNTEKILVPQPNLNTPIYQWRDVTPAGQLQLLQFVNDHRANLPIAGKPYKFKAIPGKVIGFVQTLRFLAAHPNKALTGNGIGNFSSKLAFRATGLKFTGGYPANMAYINPDFLRGHLDVYLNFFSKGPGFHSLTNSPFSVYDEMLAEYGIAGVAALTLLYFGFFARHYKKLSYGIPLLMFVAALFFIDYWFEQLSVMILFELMLVLNIKETAALQTPVKIKSEHLLTQLEPA